MYEILSTAETVRKEQADQKYRIINEDDSMAKERS